MYELLSGCYASDSNIEIGINISYSESDSSTVMNFTSAGKRFNPFDELSDDDIHMGVDMLRKIAKNISYNFDGKNNIEVIL